MPKRGEIAKAQAAGAKLSEKAQLILKALLDCAARNTSDTCEANSVLMRITDSLDKWKAEQIGEFTVPAPISKDEEKQLGPSDEDLLGEPTDAPLPDEREGEDAEDEDEDEEDGEDEGELDDEDDDA